MTSLRPAVTRRIRGLERRLAELVRESAPVTWTALRAPDGQATPLPSEFAAYGDNSWIAPPSRIRNPGRIAIGSDVVLMEFSTVWVFDESFPPEGPLVTVGDGVRLGRFTYLLSEVGVSIGDGVGSSDSATIVDTWRLPFLGAPPPAVPRPEPRPVVIGAGAYLAMNCIVGPGVHVGEGAYVGEGAVVIDDVPPHTVVTGNPASVTRAFDATARVWNGRPWH